MKRSVITATALGLAIVLGSLTANAGYVTGVSLITTPGYSGGKAVSFADSSCFSDDYGAAQNTCAGIKGWVVPVYAPSTPYWANYDTGHSTVINVDVYSPTITGGSCYMNGQTSAQQSYGSSGVAYSSTSPIVPVSTTNLNWTTTATPIAWEVVCDLPQYAVMGPAWSAEYP